MDNSDLNNQSETTSSPQSLTVGDEVGQVATAQQTNTSEDTGKQPAPSATRNTFLLLGVLSLFTIAGPFLVFLAIRGQSGSEFIGLLLLPVLLLGLVIAVINVVFTSGYLIRYRTTARNKLLGGLFILLSVLFLAAAAYPLLKDNPLFGG